MKPHVLIVDDEPDFPELVGFNLVRQGFEISVAANGMEALRLARRELPTVILLDLMLPDLDGFSVCEILRAQPSTRDIPVIMVTAVDTTVARERGDQAGVDYYLTKGVDMRLLGETVRRFSLEHQQRLARQQAEQQGEPALKTA